MMRHRSMFCLIGMVALTVMAGGSACHAVQLPTDHPYQQVMRSYLSTLTVEDFELEVEQIAFDRSAYDDDDLMFRTWVLHQKLPAAQTTGIIREPEFFTLDAIEGDDGIHMTVGRGKWISAEAAAWWTTYDSPANPYFQSRPLRLRAFVAAAVDMMMLDQWHEQGKAKRGDWLGGTLTWLAYTYTVVRDELPPEVQKAYETGLTKMVQRLMAWGPNRVNDNMDVQALTALWYTSQALDNPEMQAAIKEHVAKVLTVYHDSGMVHDAGGLDATYNGIAYYFLTWAALASDWPAVDQMHAKTSRLKSYLSLPEPDGRWYSPSHFNSRTSAGVTNDQWADNYRDVGAAMASPEATFLMYTGRQRSPRQRLASRTDMLNSIQNHVGRLNRSLKPSNAAPGLWVQSHWTHSINFAYEYYVPGSYQRFTMLAQQDDPLTHAAFEQAPGWMRAFPEDGSRRASAFVVGRPGEGDFGFILYHGPLGWHSYMNYGGGCLSAFWTPATGSVLLGRSGSWTQGKWPEWRTWPTHALSGVTSKGTPFSSARVRQRVMQSTSRVSDTLTTVRSSGAIGQDIDDGRAGPLNGRLEYARNFKADADGLTITTTAQFTGDDRIVECYEILPVFIHDSKDQPAPQSQTAIRFRIGDQWQEPGQTAMENVTAIELTRFDGRVEIRFDQPRRVQLSPEAWEDNYQTQSRVRNLMIDLMGSQDAFASGQVEYWIGSVPKPSTEPQP